MIREVRLVSLRELKLNVMLNLCEGMSEGFWRTYRRVWLRYSSRRVGVAEFFKSVNAEQFLLANLLKVPPRPRVPVLRVSVSPRLRVSASPRRPHE